MRIVVHDYAGHPFPVGLSRELARRGHAVWHLYFAEDPGPKGALSARPDDPRGLTFDAVSIGGTYEKDALLARRFKDIAYGRRVAERIRSIAPDVVLSGNTPTEAQNRILGACEKAGARFVFWVQDFYSIAVTRLLAKRLGVFGHIVGGYYQAVEKRLLRRSAGIVVITDDFVPLAARWIADADRIEVIENWGAVAEIAQLPRDTAWARRHGLENNFVFQYTGTLGLKHDPELLAALAQRFAGRAKIIVVAQGLNVPRLAELKRAHGISNLDILGPQPFADLPDVLASADVLVAAIEEDAGVFSVPSKVQSYLCAGRPILLSAPAQNLAARTLADAKAGLVTKPGAVDGFLDAAERLFADAALRKRLGANGRDFAIRQYDIGSICTRFEAVFDRALTGTSTSRRLPRTLWRQPERALRT